ncbi:MAG: carbonic anhydrase [Flavobacteriales bacterium]|nr:carbonic anhydrase [Flavobacteriales bacterium]
MDSYEQLLMNNKVWAESMTERDPDFFKRLTNVQQPEFLWIGCSDSRVPANEITGTLPGQIFVHRNIANMVVNIDVNLLSVLQYAVEVLKVKHVIVCGHYGCGGVAAALTNRSFGILDTWLRNIKDVYRLHKEEVDAMPTEQQRQDRMVELNVMEQVMDLSKTTIIQKSWKNRGGPHLHGWVYRLSDGVIKPVMEMNPGSELDPVHRYDIEE